MYDIVFICTTGTVCSTKLAELSESTSPDLIPIIVLVTMSGDDRLDTRLDRTSQDFRTPSPSGPRLDPIETFMTEDIYGIRLLHHIALDIQNDTSTKLIVPIALFKPAEGGNRASLSSIQRDSTSGAWFASSESTASGSHEPPTARQLAIEPSQMLRCLDAGAADVLITPLQQDRVFALTTHAYRARKEAKKERSAFLTTKRMRKRSWVGIDEEKPYAYLRESM
jgi:3',5'-cyclic-nucleotide phosphodiesterase